MGSDNIVFAIALAICQVVNIVALIVGLTDSVWLVFMPSIALAALVAVRYGVLMVKVIIIAIRSMNR